MNENNVWTDKYLESLDNKIKIASSSLLSYIILTEEELDFIEHITARRLEQINDGYDCSDYAETDRDTLISFRKDLLVYYVHTNLIKRCNLPIDLPAYRLTFFQTQLKKLNKIERKCMNEWFKNKEK